jgi:hypothetical protein
LETIRVGSDNRTAIIRHLLFSQGNKRSPTQSGSDRIEVGRIYEYIYFSSDHEEITGSFVYNVTSTFSFYRSQVEGAPNLVTQGQDYGAATAVVYRATVPNSISVPTLIDATNISVVNLSVTGDITTPAATITDLTIGSGGIFNHDLTNNLVDVRLANGYNTGGLVVSGSLNNINMSNCSITNLSADNTSILNDMTITRDLQVQRFLDVGRPSFIMCTRTGSIALSGTSFLATYNSATTAQQNSQFTFTSGGSGIVANTGGWYRVSWAFGFIRTSIVGGDRAQVRSYIQVRPAVGSYTFDASKHTISSTCYLRRNNQCREGHITGYNFVYIEAGGALNILIQAMVEGSTTWNSSLAGISLRGASNIMVEFVSSINIIELKNQLLFANGLLKLIQMRATRYWILRWVRVQLELLVKTPNEIL